LGGHGFTLCEGLPRPPNRILWERLQQKHTLDRQPEFIAMDRFSQIVLGALLAISLGCATSRSSDIAYAMRPGTGGFMSYESTGNAASDSASAIAAAAMWDLEGGDTMRGLRLLEEALRRPVADTMFYRDAWYVSGHYRRLDLRAKVESAASRQFPGHQWRWPR
jgi:hypothetical protein